MTRALRKATMLRSRLQNKHNKSRTAESWNRVRKQGNRCVKLFRQAKKTTTVSWISIWSPIIGNSGKQ